MMHAIIETDTNNLLTPIIFREMGNPHRGQRQHPGESPRSIASSISQSLGASTTSLGDDDRRARSMTGSTRFDRAANCVPPGRRALPGVIHRAGRLGLISILSTSG